MRAEKTAIRKEVKIDFTKAQENNYIDILVDKIEYKIWYSYIEPINEVIMLFTGINKQTQEKSEKCYQL